MRRASDFLKTGAILLTVNCLAVSARASGIYGDGTGATAMAMGGADVAWAADPLGAMGDNPAGLGFLDAPELSLGGEGAVLQGRFNKPGVSTGDLDQSPNGLPEGAFAFPLKKWPVTLGISCFPDAALLDEWHYHDPPGGLGGISYGNQEDKSEIIVLRSALGAAMRINSKLSLGASIGLVYNQNELVTPYIFQNLQPSGTYDGAKTLLDLKTSGFGWDYQLGLIYQPVTNLQFGVSYKGDTTVDTTGDASGDPYAQFPPTPPGPLAFHYNADVKNTFPQEVSAGLSWKFLPKWRVALQTDWIGWAGAFSSLPVKLSNGSNPGVNGVLGSSFQDNIPLNWKDEFVYRAGVEYALLNNLWLRTGYSHGNSPVPDSTLNPITAAIMEQEVSAGVGCRLGRWDFDLAYQYQLPHTQYVTTSGLRSGEYSDSSTEVSAHVLALTVNIRL